MVLAKKLNLAKPRRGNEQQNLDLSIFSIFFNKKGLDNSIMFMIKGN